MCATKAAAGVPKPMAEHAVIMCRFAHDCMKRMQRLLPQLETQLGPATADLKARIGIHSGGVTGGVLRGEKARFQLFGDTMNTASRMERYETITSSMACFPNRDLSLTQ